MIIVLLGGTSTGKSTIERELIDNCYLTKIIPFTTRSIRDNEINGIDYCFIGCSEFEELLSENQFATYEKYPQNRFYGTLYEDYEQNEWGGDKIVILTPQQYRQLRRNVDNKLFFSVLLKANLGTRVKRYIERCGVNKFSYDDKNEINNRVERDYGAFLGMDNEVNLVINNNDEDDVQSIVNNIIMEFIKYKERVKKK